MKYTLKFKKKALKFLDKLPKHELDVVLSKINQLPHGQHIRPMKGYRDTYRLRVGDYRIIYEKNDTHYVILVIDAGSRGDVYK